MREKTFETFYPENDLEQLPPLERAQVKGWVSSVFWGLRVYILIMLVLVVIGFSRGYI
ncbi:hypothetical protein [Ferroacidibacillus organovorans]|uniref:hypothetical protein n=1 Tax=Ferroacidibacillus organovorans TaxID=1765683 RepID=UPI000A41CCC2|nr:hypothetical protein [Ferroacidibacillus organovorans]